jgi:hypothetical protein
LHDKQIQFSELKCHVLKKNLIKRNIKTDQSIH